MAKKPTKATKPSERKVVATSPPELTLETFELILIELRRCGSKYRACEALGYDYSTVHQAIKGMETQGDDSWRGAWDTAYDQWRDRLEQEAFRRGHDGVPVEWRVDPTTGDRVPVKIEFSDRMLEILLKGHFPERFRDKVFVSGTIGMEPIDAFSNLTSKAKREIREIIMRDLEEQRELAATKAQGEVIEGMSISRSIEDMRGAVA